MNPPFFSIIICNYNYGRFVGDAIDSCIAQRYPTDLFEVIVVDDGSTDESRQILAGYAGRPNVIVVMQENGGQAAAFAAGVRRARGDYVCLLDADDLFAPDKLAAVGQRIEELAPSAAEFFLCHDLELVEHPGERVLERSWFQMMGITSFGESAHLATLNHFFPFSIPCGQVYGRVLLERVMEAVLPSDWRQGADSPLAQAALILCGRVHYLPGRLGRYRIHGTNHVAFVREGQYQTRPETRLRWPKQLRFLEALIDSVDFDSESRNQRLAYIARLEQVARAASARRGHAEPWLSLIIDARADEKGARATLASIRAQTHPRCEIVWIAGKTQSPRSEPGERVTAVDGSQSGWFDTMRSAHAASRGDYFAFVDAGDCLDSTFAERHLHVHRYTALAQMTCCDFSLVDASETMIHFGVMVGAGRWKPGLQHIPPFGAGMRDWLLAPLSTCVFRRTPLLDGFFALSPAELGDGLDDAAGWLLAQYALCLGGVARIAETLLAFRVPDGASANPAWLLAPCTKRGPLAPPDFARAGRALFAAYCVTRSAARGYMPATWERNFASWLVQAGGPQLAAQLEAQARVAGIERSTGPS